MRKFSCISRRNMLYILYVSFGQALRAYNDTGLYRENKTAWGCPDRADVTGARASSRLSLHVGGFD